MEEIQEQHNLYRVRVEREVRESREMVVYAAPWEQAEDYARDAAAYLDVPNVLYDGEEWDEEDTEYSTEASKADLDEFDEDEAEVYRDLIEQRLRKQPEPVDFDKLTAAGGKVNLRGSGMLKGKIHHIFAIQEGETIGHHGWGDTVGAAVRDAAQNNQKLHSALADCDQGLFTQGSAQ